MGITHDPFRIRYYLLGANVVWITTLIKCSSAQLQVIRSRTLTCAIHFYLLLATIRCIMTETELKELGFEKDMCFDEHTGKWKMPWGGSIEVNEKDDIHSLLLRVFNIGRSTGISEGESIGEAKLQHSIRDLLGL